MTAKPEPADFDMCWDVKGVDEDWLHLIFLVMDNSRKIQREVFGGEIFPSRWIADPQGTKYLDYFQRSKKWRPVGIVALDPGALP